MRALMCKRFGSVEDLVVENIEAPKPGAGQVVVDVKAAGLNFPDLLTIAGKYQVRNEPPFVPGIEASGVISSLGEGVSEFAVGDRVILTTPDGAFAEKCVVDVSRVMPMPDSIDFEQGAGFAIAFATSYHAFRQCAPIEPGQSVLVLGAAGGVGTTAVEIASLMDARVIAAASSDEKLEFARQAGATDLINYERNSLKESVSNLTEGKGVDVVYDPVGGGMARQALSALGWHGRYLVIGFASGEIPSFPANLLLLKEASVKGVYWGDWAAKNAIESNRNMKEIAGFVAAGKLRPRVSSSYRLEQFSEAFAEIAQRRVMGKVVFKL